MWDPPDPFPSLAPPVAHLQWQRNIGWWVEPVGGVASWVTATLVEEQMKAGPAHILPLTSNLLCSSLPQCLPSVRHNTSGEGV